MGAMKDFYLARQEWAESISKLIDERVEILEDEKPEVWKVALQDGVTVTKIDDWIYVDVSFSVDAEANDEESVRDAIIVARQIGNN